MTAAVQLTVSPDLVDDVASALRSLATHYRSDTSHDAISIAELRASADRLDDLADKLEDAINAPKDQP